MIDLSILNFSTTGLLNSPLVQQLIHDRVFHLFCSLVRKRKGKKISRSRRRKMMNRRKRWFTDNIIMHHKRLHDKNRQIVISSAKSKVSARRLTKEKEHLITPQGRSWRDRVEIKDRGRIIRGRVSAKKLRARSRWLSVAEVSIG